MPTTKTIRPGALEVHKQLLIQWKKNPALVRKVPTFLLTKSNTNLLHNSPTNVGLNNSKKSVKSSAFHVTTEELKVLMKPNVE